MVDETSDRARQRLAAKVKACQKLLNGVLVPVLHPGKNANRLKAERVRKREEELEEAKKALADYDDKRNNISKN